ncbi:MAG: nucleotide excision repair endonuclease [Kiritimatiellae bacterium]|nr:nucleotide excision repair endonuclease [Kiritimatiellia bacterium]
MSGSGSASGGVLDAALAEGFRIVLIGAGWDSTRRKMRARMVRLEGGRVAADVRGELDVWSGESDLARALYEGLMDVAAPPHLLVLWGGAARSLLARAATAAMLGTFRVLDLRRAVLVLRPESRARADGEALLVAMGVGGVADAESPMDDRVIDLLWAVLAEAQRRGWGWAELLGRASAPRSLEATGGVALDPDALTELPEAPAVYRLLDAARRVVYIGQTGNLRRRVAEHLRATDAPTPKTVELGRRVRAIEYRRVGSELEARLYEDRWIRRWCPPLNVAVRTRRRRGGRGAAWAVVIVARSAEEGAVEVFGWRPGSSLWQLRVREGRMPRRRLEALWEVLTGRRRRMPRGDGITAWGRIGAELAARMFRARRARWIWLRPESFPDAEAWLAAFGVAIREVKAGPPEGVEYRWTDSEEVPAGPHRHDVTG